MFLKALCSKWSTAFLMVITLSVLPALLASPPNTVSASEDVNVKFLISNDLEGRNRSLEMEQIASNISDYGNDIQGVNVETFHSWKDFADKLPQTDVDVLILDKSVLGEVNVDVISNHFLSGDFVVVGIGIPEEYLGSMIGMANIDSSWEDFETMKGKSINSVYSTDRYFHSFYVKITGENEEDLAKVYESAVVSDSDSGSNLDIQKPLSISFGKNTDSLDIDDAVNRMMIPVLLGVEELNKAEPAPTAVQTSGIETSSSGSLLHLTFAGLTFLTLLFGGFVYKKNNLDSPSTSKR